MTITQTYFNMKLISSTLGFAVLSITLLSLFSCNKDDDNDSESDLTFSQTCDFSGSNVETVNRLSGSLSYTNNIMNIPPSELPPNAEYVFLIRSPPLLQMAVCNMPAGFEMAEGESINVTFSGRVVVFSNGIYPDEVDASNTWIELSYLKFE